MSACQHPSLVSHPCSQEPGTMEPGCRILWFLSVHYQFHVYSWCLTDVSRWFVMTFGFAILICSSFFEGWASWVPGAQLIPPSYSTHVVPFSTAGASPVRQYQAAQAGAQWKRLLVHSKAWKSGGIPWYVGTFLFLSILSITVFQMQIELSQKLFENGILLPLDPPKLELV